MDQSSTNLASARLGEENRNPQADTSFVSYIATLRARARRQIEDGALTPSYGLDTGLATELLNTALATELACVMRYRQHAVVASGELDHADTLARRIVQLGGAPGMDPADLSSCSHAEYVVCDSLQDMIRENLIAERIAIESYREMIQVFGDKDPTTCAMLVNILAKEEEHADELADLLS